MEKQNENLRERLLARMPQPEKLAAYREETEVLLARHKKALFWERFSAVAFAWLGMIVWMIANSTWGPKLGVNQKIVFETFAGFLVLAGGFAGVGYRIGQSEAYLLKEIKQVQLQILELQASFKKRDDTQ
jgi:hypothetical protein